MPLDPGVKEYSMEIVERCEQLYCVDGQTFEAVATLTGVAAGTLKRWSAQYGWQEKKEQIRQAFSGIRTNTIILRAKLIENCMNTLNAQDAFAVSAMESLAQRATQAAKSTGAQAPQLPENLREIRSDEDAIAALEEALEIKVNRMLADPGQLNFSAMRDLKQVMDLVRDLKTKRSQAGETKSTGLTPQAADRIRRDILGIKG
jgi:transposase-like protein